MLGGVDLQPTDHLTLPYKLHLRAFSHQVQCSTVTCVKLHVFLPCTKIWCFLQMCLVLIILNDTPTHPAIACTLAHTKMHGTTELSILVRCDLNIMPAPFFARFRSCLLRNATCGNMQKKKHSRSDAPSCVNKPLEQDCVQF